MVRRKEWNFGPAGRDERRQGLPGELGSGIPGAGAMWAAAAEADATGATTDATTWRLSTRDGGGQGREGWERKLYEPDQSQV